MGVMHGALAIIRRNGTPVGRMRNVRWTETLRDQEVQGIGTILVQESPVVAHNGQLTAEFYEVEFETTGIPGAVRRDVQNNQQFEDQILLREPLQVDIFKKVEDAIDPNTGLKTARAQPYAIIRDLFLNSEGADISEGAISGHNQTFRFNSPVIYPR